MQMKNCIYLNLQLFAEAELVSNTTASAGMSPEMKELWDKTLIRVAEAKLVHHQDGQKRPVPANNGKTVKFRRFAALPKATTPLTEGVTPPGKELSVSEVQATLSQYGDYVRMTDVLQLTALDPMAEEALKLVGSQGGATMDTVVRNILNAGTNVFYCPKVENGVQTQVESRGELTQDCQLTTEVIDTVVAILSAQNAPRFPDGFYHAIVHPYSIADVRRDENWRKPHEYTDPEHIYKGEIGEYGGVRFFDTSEAKIFSGEEDGCPDGLGVFSTLIYGENAYGVTDIDGGNMEVIVKQKGSGGTADPLEQRSTVGWKCMQTAEILIPNYLVRVEGCSKRFSSMVTAN